MYPLYMHIYICTYIYIYISICMCTRIYLCICLPKRIVPHPCRQDTAESALFSSGCLQQQAQRPITLLSAATQTAQYGSVKEQTLNHVGESCIIESILVYSLITPYSALRVRKKLATLGLAARLETVQGSFHRAAGSCRGVAAGSGVLTGLPSSCPSRASH